MFEIFIMENVKSYMAIEPYLIEPFQIDPNIFIRKIYSLLRLQKFSKLKVGRNVWNNFCRVKFWVGRSVISHTCMSIILVLYLSFQNQNLILSWLSSLSFLFHRFLLLHKNKPSVLNKLLSCLNQRRNKNDSYSGLSFDKGSQMATVRCKRCTWLLRGVTWNAPKSMWRRNLSCYGP